MHPLERADRPQGPLQEHQASATAITKFCTEVCPEHIKITDNAIIPMKERVVDNKYYPLVWLGRRSSAAISWRISRPTAHSGTGARAAPARTWLEQLAWRHR